MMQNFSDLVLNFGSSRIMKTIDGENITVMHYLVYYNSNQSKLDDTWAYYQILTYFEFACICFSYPPIIFLGYQLFQHRIFHQNLQNCVRAAVVEYLIQLTSRSVQIFLIFNSEENGLVSFSLPGFVIERCCASYFLSDYEKRSRHYISILLLTTSAGSSALLSYLYHQSESTLAYHIIVLVINGISSVVLAVIEKYNYTRLHESSNLRKSKREYSLAERFQISENIRVCELMKTIINVVALFNLLSTASAALDNFNFSQSFLNVAATFFNFCVLTYGSLVFFLFYYLVPQFRLALKLTFTKLRILNPVSPFPEALNEKPCQMAAKETDEYFTQLRNHKVLELHTVLSNTPPAPIPPSPAPIPPSPAPIPPPTAPIPPPVAPIPPPLALIPPPPAPIPSPPAPIPPPVAPIPHPPASIPPPPAPIPPPPAPIPSPPAPIPHPPAPIPPPVAPIPPPPAPMPPPPAPITPPPALIPSPPAPIPPPVAPIPHPPASIPPPPAPMPPSPAPIPPPPALIPSPPAPIPSPPRTQDPGPRTQDPVPRTQDPGPRTQDPGPRTQDPGPRTQDPGPRTQDPGPRTQDPGPRTQDPGPRTQDPGPRTQDPGPRTQDPGPRTQDPGPRTQDPGPRTQDPGPRTQDPGPRTQDPGPRTQDPGPRTQDPGPRTQDPGPRTQDPGPRAPDPRAPDPRVPAPAEAGELTDSHSFSHPLYAKNPGRFLSLCSIFFT
ncbi:hypothetical protein B9Z55_005342 [Caenorhabditis nigoni]|uniref:Uncharacterized protein n=2 Tax=Caenorhabditis nigoni TaxID=1611254 RepID=A0A2G5V0E8_9PELO|nr:hypothetical protein B9Z55_005342 [Caenorhabditis nigoni]